MLTAAPAAAGGVAAAAAGAAPNAYHVALRRLTGGFVVAAGFSAIINVLMLTGSIYMLQVYDRVLASGSVPTLLGLFAIVVVLYGFLAFYDFLRGRLLGRAAIQLDLGIGAASFDGWVGAGLPGGPGGGWAGGSGPGHPGGGAQSTQPLRDLEMLRGFLSGSAVTAIFDLPWVPLYLGVLFVIHPWLGWLTVAGAAVVAGIALLNRQVTKGPIRQALTQDGAERDFTDKSHRAAEAILAMGMQKAVTTRWRVLHDASLASGQTGSDPSELLAAASRAFRMLLQSAMLTLGAWLVLRGDISGGMIIASSILSGRALAPVDQIIGQWRTIGRAAEAHRRLTGFFAAHSQEKPRIRLPDPTGQITVTGLTKLAPGKPGTERARILNQISFSLEPGDGLGVIGSSASGKSTLARLLVGAWQADAGEIRLDGATPDQWDPVHLGRRIGYLPQMLDMLPGSIRDNIARFDPAAQDGAVIEAARLAGVHDMILKLPDGYATYLGGTGNFMPLSGGQIQRLGLARAIYGKPSLVILDEPNSNLDIAGDDALTLAIAALRAAGSVVIVMAHRPSAIAAVNKVMILQGGAIVNIGDKDAVLATARQSASVRPPGASRQSAGVRVARHRATQAPVPEAQMQEVPVPEAHMPEIPVPEAQIQEIPVPEAHVPAAIGAVPASPPAPANPPAPASPPEITRQPEAASLLASSGLPTSSGLPENAAARIRALTGSRRTARGPVAVPRSGPDGRKETP